MSDYTEKNSNLIPQIDIPCFAWNSQAEQGFLFFKAKSLATADFMIHSTLMNEQYSHQIENFKNTVDVRVKEMQ